MSRRLEGRVAVITGAADGMGRATARRFVEEGARVVLADVQEEKGTHLADELGDLARYVRCDVREEHDLAATVGVAVETFGGLDIMQHFAAAGWRLRDAHLLGCCLPCETNQFDRLRHWQGSGRHAREDRGVQYAADFIRVNVILPGAFSTPITPRGSDTLR